MPTKEQRRATARRKLQRQLERRAQRARRRRIWTIAGASALAIAAVAAVVVIFVLNRDSDTAEASPTSTPTSSAPAPEGTVQLPAFNPPAEPGANCTYPASAQPAAKQVNPPRTGKIPTEEKQISVSMVTNQGNIGIQLDNEKSPCTVNSFASLAQQGFFNETLCPRLTTAPQLSVLQCGSATDSTSGGPGYEFADEYPTNQYPPTDPGLAQNVIYPRGTLAMANAGPNTNGSQFFMVYQDTVLPPNYTVFGTIDETGMATLDKIAAAGTVDGSQDGRPKLDVRITSVRVD